MAQNVFGGLRKAVETNNMTSVFEFIAQGVDVGATRPQWSGESLLFVAKTADMVQVLLRQGANANEPNDHRESPLLYAVQSRRRYDVVSELARNTIIVDCPDKNGDTPLHYAVRTRRPDLHIIQLLMQNGASAFHPNRYGCTPIASACVDSAAIIIQHELFRHAENVSRLITSDVEKNDYLWHCYAEIRRLVSFKIMERYTAYDFIKERDENTLALCAQNEEFKKECHRLSMQSPIYGHLLNKNFELGKVYHVANLLNGFQSLNIFEVVQSVNLPIGIRIVMDEETQRMVAGYMQQSWNISDTTSSSDTEEARGDVKKLKLN